MKKGAKEMYQKKWVKKTRTNIFLKNVVSEKLNFIFMIHRIGGIDEPLI